MAVVLGPGTQRWFAPSRTLAIQLPPEGSLGLRNGADVQILGSIVGSVEDITVTDAGTMQAQVTVRGNFIRFVRADSHAVIRKPFGIGDPYIEITRGSGEPLARGVSLHAVADKEPSQMIEETLSAVRDEALPAIKELRVAIAQYSQLAAELRDERGNLQQALSHLNRLGTTLERGEGVAGMLLSDPKPARELRAALPRLNASLDEMHAALASTRKLADRLPRIGADLELSMQNIQATSAEAARLASALPGMEKSVRQALDTLPGVLLQHQETLYQIQRLTEGVQRSWLVRGYMEPPGAGGRLSSERVGTDR